MEVWSVLHLLLTSYRRGNLGTCLAIAVLDVWFPLLYPSVTPVIVLFMLYILNLRKTKKQREKIRNQMWERLPLVLLRDPLLFQYAPDLV